MEENVTKVCNKCGRELPVSAFNKKTMSKDGLQDVCRECQSAYSRKYLLKKKAEAHKMIPVYTNPELAKFHPRELMAELKARGFRWEYMLEPQRKIMWEKV